MTLSVAPLTFLLSQILADLLLFWDLLFVVDSLGEADTLFLRSVTKFAEAPMDCHPRLLDMRATSFKGSGTKVPSVFSTSGG